MANEVTIIERNEEASRDRHKNGMLLSKIKRVDPLVGELGK